MEEDLPDPFLEEPPPLRREEEPENIISSDLQQDKEECPWPSFPFCWPDFLPGQLAQTFASPQELPSLLSVIDDVSESLPNGGSEFWFNFVFSWWFTVPVDPVDEVAPTPKNKIHPCTKCDSLFQHEWEVSRHYIERHISVSPAAPPPKRVTPPPSLPTSPPPPPPPAPREKSPDLLFEPPPWWEEVLWAWEDFLPLWELHFLPTPVRQRWSSLSIEEEEATPSPKATPPPPCEATPPPPPRPRSPPPVIKQTKYHCRTCNIIICNNCFTKKCGAHTVDFQGTAKFSCMAC